MITTGLLERDRELATLQHAAERAATGEPGLILIKGDAGLGKTSLLDAAAAEFEAAHGFQVLRARGGMLERTLGWGVARQLFEELVVRGSASARNSLLRGPASLAVPALALGTATGGAAPVRDFRFEHGLYWLVCNLTERGPLALAVDDAQWCDDATLGWLLYLARRIEALPVVVLVAVRSGEPDAPTDFLDVLESEPVAETVVLSPLGVPGATALLEEAYGSAIDGEFGVACHSWTGGNPLFLTELAAELAAEGVEPTAAAVPRVGELRPEGASRVALLALARLSEPAQELARAVAVLETVTQLRSAAALAGLDEGTAVAAADELMGAHVLATGYPLHFVHPLIRSVVYDDIQPARRAIAHQRAARLLSESGAELGRVAAQLLRSQPAGEPWVVEQLMAGADDELARGSPTTAIALLRRACGEPPRQNALAGALLALGRAETLSGDVAGLETLRRGLEASDDPRERGQIAVVLGRMLYGVGDPRAAVDEIRRVADELGWEDADLRLQLEAALVNAARSDVRSVGLIPERLRGVREHSSDDTRGGRLIAAQLSWGLTAIGAPVERTVEFARRALAGGRLISEAAGAPEAYMGAIHMLTFADEIEEAEQLLALALEAARQSGSEPNYAGASCFLAYAQYLHGLLAHAELSARDALRTSTDAPMLVFVHRLATAYLALTLVDRGAIEEASALLARNPPALEDAPVTWATELMFAAGRASIATGRYQDGLDQLLACGRRALAWSCVNPAWLPWRSEAAFALLQLGERDQAARLADEELELARSFGARRPIGIALRTRGLIDGRDDGLAMLKESAEVLASSPAQLERARSWIALGCALRRANRRGDARTPLTEGLKLATSCGAVPLAEEARTELTAAGARPRSVWRVGADSLTASERRVCELAASGKTNPEIAQSLFVSRATVESHLHSAYQKLDIASRRELGDALSSAGGERCA